MTLEEAIKILTYGGTQKEFLDAIRLGIEALKRELRSRGIQTIWEIRKLPGETEE